jgi:DNA-binding transcriptional MerR regulator
MWMAELSSRSGLPVPTIKYYLRAGLLHPGQSVGATRASYDESHLRRLRLIRALTDVARLSLDVVSQVLSAVDDPGLSWHDALGSAHARLGPTRPSAPSPEAVARVERLMRRRAWRLGEGSPHAVVLAAALSALAGLGHDPDDTLLETYADAADAIALREIDAITETDRTDAVEHVVVGTLLLEPVLLAMRRIAQENASRRAAR